MQQKEKKDFPVFSQHLAGWLMMQGYVLLKCKPSNKGDKRRNTFFFRETKSLAKSIEDYKQLQQNKKI